MSTPAGSGVPGPPSGAWRRASWRAGEMRIGDAERAEVTDRLAWHFSHGRLDQAELDDRLDRAMRAKTAADLAGLLADLPGGGPGQQPPDTRQRRLAELEEEARRIERERRDLRRGRRRLRGGLRTIVVFLAMIVGVVAVTHALTRSVLVWLAIGLVAFLVLRHHARRTERLAPDSGVRCQPDDPVDTGTADQ
jgi:hypothetical protein